MQTSKVKEKLMRLPGAHALFTRFLQRTNTFVVGTEQKESDQLYETTNQCQVRQLEAERLKAKAQEFSQDFRRRLM